VTNRGIQCDNYANVGSKRAESVAALMPETGEVWYCGGYDGVPLSDCYFTTASSKVWQG